MELNVYSSDNEVFELIEVDVSEFGFLETP